MEQTLTFLSFLNDANQKDEDEEEEEDTKLPPPPIHHYAVHTSFDTDVALNVHFNSNFKEAPPTLCLKMTHDKFCLR